MSENTQITEETILEALRVVVDPELNLDVVTLGLIRGIDVDASPIHIKMILTTPFCPFAPWMIDQVRKAATKVVGGEVEVEMLAEQWHPDMMEDPSLLGF
jgi:metal-sulfur cluster biosynthetic enzyme